jgi:hypothetical protein
LIDRVLGPHDNEQIDVALLMRFPVGVGAKENDFVRLKALGDAARETANRGQGNVGRGVTVRLHVSGGRLFFGHAVILQQNPPGQRILMTVRRL